MQRRKPQKTSLQPATADNEPHVVNCYYGALVTDCCRIAPDPVVDPLLSSFICNLPSLDTKDESEESNSTIAFAKLILPHEQRYNLPIDKDLESCWQDIEFDCLYHNKLPLLVLLDGEKSNNNNNMIVMTIMIIYKRTLTFVDYTIDCNL